MTIQAGTVFAMVPPAIPGLGASGGLQLQLEDRRNLGPTEMQQAINAMLASYHSKPALAFRLQPVSGKRSPVFSEYRPG